MSQTNAPKIMKEPPKPSSTPDPPIPKKKARARKKKTLPREYVPIFKNEFNSPSQEQSGKKNEVKLVNIKNWLYFMTFTFFVNEAARVNGL